MNNPINRRQYRILNQELEIPLLRIVGDDIIKEFNLKEEDVKTLFNVQLEYVKNVPFDDIRMIKKNYYVRSIHSFIFIPTLADTLFDGRRIFEVELSLSNELEQIFERKIYEADPLYKLWNYFKSFLFS